MSPQPSNINAPDKNLIVGWRGWQLVRPYFLVSGNWAWLPHQRIEAECNYRREHRADNEDDFAPYRRCTCGVYSFNAPRELKDQGYGTQEILGEVYHWGKVIEHSRGYRAQYAYPKKLYVKLENGSRHPKELYEYVAWTYGVPIEFVDTELLLIDEVQKRLNLKLAQAATDPKARKSMDAETKAFLHRQGRGKKRVMDYHYLVDLVRREEEEKKNNAD